MRSLMISILSQGIVLSEGLYYKPGEIPFYNFRLVDSLVNSKANICGEEYLSIGKYKVDERGFGIIP
ncbi:MAG: hypothetical protein QG646_2549 [Euryarchaeota archaeon]|nr:hypothetical protein [Euryarchaeota archaeon]